MNDSHLASRVRLIFAAALAIALCLGSYWVLEVIRRGFDNPTASAVRTDPDYFVEKFNFVRASKLGQARYAISGARLTHLPKDDSYEISLPIMKSLSVEKPAITMRAQRAISNSDASQVQLFDNVQIDRPESKGSPHFHLNSEYVMVYPDDDVMQSDRLVDITQGNTEVTGIGMYANNATLMFSLARNVHSVTQPQVH